MLDRDAEALRDRFEAAFWLEDRGFYAMALDRDKRPVDSIASNAGQCLWSGIVSPERAERMVARLLDPALFSGWGVRTYAAGQTGYNPLGYHTGAVWPHDVALIAAGLKRYGLVDAAERVAVPLLEAAATFPTFRLPELFCGYGRDAGSGPVPYPVACSPQAWSAGAPFLILRTMLGLQADADAGRLELVEPHMPRWIGSLRVRGLAVGSASVDLLIHTWRGTTSAEVLARHGELDVTVRL
jgi:glycogen debranching enzyme